MKKSQSPLLVTDNGSINLPAWIQSIGIHYPAGENSLILQAANLAQLTGAHTATSTGQSCLHQGLFIAEILAELQVDPEALAAGILYSCVRYAGLRIEDITEQVSPAVGKLIRGVKKMDAMQTLQTQMSRNISHAAIDNLRKMLLAMVDDVRIVLIKLAEQLAILRHMTLLSDQEKQYQAKITQDIYAPLANRLGIGQLKWELEDFAFRYLDPDTYRRISKALNATRSEREIYVKNVIQLLQQEMNKIGIEKLDIIGRAKHIYSIYRKMQRKNVGLEEIYDAIAFRILVPNIADVYSALGYVHSHWKPIPKEFDDYITQPKPNGYRSVHTAVIGPEDKTMEVQIRTFDMDQEAELGVAAHWVYKEGKAVKAGYEAKIAWLRQVIDWQKELSQTEKTQEQPLAEIFEDHVYVFTPQGDVIELLQGSTPLDFAYHVHTSIGHRCRGAKINGHMVTLTYKLKTGDCVEILTMKEGHPSRDWLNANLGYLHTARAKSKVHHWFRQQNNEKHLQEGQAILEKETRRLGLKAAAQLTLAQKLHYAKIEELYAAIGRGDITLPSLLHHLQEFSAPTATEEPLPLPTTFKPLTAQATDIDVQGMGNLLTHIAACCKPIPGDAIIGYITQGQGVSIHRQDCTNILHVSPQHKPRLLEVSWGDKTQNKYLVDLIVEAYDRPGLIRDITQLLVNERVNIVGLNYITHKTDNTGQVNLTIEIHSLSPLSRILTQIMQLNNVIDARRV